MIKGRSYTKPGYYDSDAGKVHTGQRMGIGYNLCELQDWQTQQPYIDYMVHNRLSPGDGINTGSPPQDANGWYDCTAVGDTARYYVYDGQSSQYNWMGEENWVCRWDGTGDPADLVWSGATKIGTPSAGRQELSFPNNESRILNINDGYPTNITLVRASQETAYHTNGDRVNPLWVGDVGGAYTIRHVNMMDTVPGWTGSKSEYDGFFPHPHEDNRVTMEGVNELSAETGAIPWINVPEQHEDFGAALANDLDTYYTSGQLIVEYTNEWWNSAFQSFSTTSFGGSVAGHTDSGAMVNGLITDTAHGMSTGDLIATMNRSSGWDGDWPYTRAYKHIVLREDNDSYYTSQGGYDEGQAWGPPNFGVFSDYYGVTAVTNAAACEVTLELSFTPPGWLNDWLTPLGATHDFNAYIGATGASGDFDVGDQIQDDSNSAQAVLTRVRDNDPINNPGTNLTLWYFLVNKAADLDGGSITNNTQTGAATTVTSPTWDEYEIKVVDTGVSQMDADGVRYNVVAADATTITLNVNSSAFDAYLPTGTDLCYRVRNSDRDALRYMDASATDAAGGYADSAVAVWNAWDAVFGRDRVIAVANAQLANTGFTVTSPFSKNAAYRERLDYVGVAPYFSIYGDYPSPDTAQNITDWNTHRDWVENTATYAEITDWIIDTHFNSATLGEPYARRLEEQFIALRAAVGHTRICCYEGGDESAYLANDTAARWNKYIGWLQSTEGTRCYTAFLSFLADNGVVFHTQYYLTGVRQTAWSDGVLNWGLNTYVGEGTATWTLFDDTIDAGGASKS